MTTAQQTALTAFQARINSNSLTSGDQALLNAALSNIIPIWGFDGTGAPPDLRGSVGDDSQNAREWMACLYAEAEGLGGGGGVVPASWLVPAWFIDPVAGNDANNGTSALTPLKTWAQLVNLWGTTGPTLRQNTVVTFLSSQPDNTDPVIWRPVVGAGAQVRIVGTPTVVTAGVILAGVVAKNRTTGQILNATLGATAAAGQLIVNTTAGKSSVAFAYAVVAGTTFKVSQPIAPVVLPLGATVPAEVDSWANGDTVNLLALTNVHIVALTPTQADASATSDAAMAVYRVNNFLPAGDGVQTPTVIGTAVSWYEASSAKILLEQSPSQAFTAFQDSGYLNVFNLAGMGGNPSGTRSILAGVIGSSVLTGAVLLDGDVIVQGFIQLSSGPFLLGLCCVDTTGTLFFFSETSLQAESYAGAILWGGGTLNTGMQGSLQYPSGAGAAVASIKVPTIKIDNAATAHSVISGAPDVFNGGITISAANLDAAAGAAGFGGNAFKPGGGSIANAV